MTDYSIVGKRFGRLTVVKLDHIGKNKNTYWLCKCDCGKEKVVYRGGLTSGDIISCGCYRNEHKHEYGLKHGLTNHPLYSIWSGMVQRCTNKNAQNYNRYGGRGIKICNEWRNDFKTFYDWAIKNGYKEGLSIERIDNNGNYEPRNCKWISPKEQYKNTRRSINITYKGETHSLAEWSRIKGINYETLRHRIVDSKWDIEKALETLPYSELITGEKD